MPPLPHTSFWIALLVGVASGSVGPFILLRRMALVGDARSHVALPGIALAHRRDATADVQEVRVLRALRQLECGFQALL